MIDAPKSDKFIGMEYYATDSPGCGGQLRQNTKDFLVRELYEEKDYEGGRFLVVEVEKENWDNHHLVRDLSRQLKISQRRISWAGTKDKNAITTQRMCIMNLDEAELERVTLPRVKIKVLGRTNKGVSLGDLLGNEFQIRIKNLAVDRNEAARCVEAITKEIHDQMGLPNYFGVQRFGDTRPVTHQVGEFLVKGDIKKAVLTYLALPFPGEPESIKAARSSLWEEGDLAKALKEYPTRLRYERAILNHLIEKDGDYAHAFDGLSANLKKLFVHAYQSYIFNKILSNRMTLGLPLDKAVLGDVVCFTSKVKGKEGLPDTSRIQAADDDASLKAVNRLMSRQRAHLTLPLFGYESKFSEGLPGRIEREVLGDEDVRFEDFRVAQNPDLGSPGLRRPALLRVEPKWKVEDEVKDGNGNEGGDSVLIQFSLPPGSYATVVLREYMKT